MFSKVASHGMQANPALYFGAGQKSRVSPLLMARLEKQLKRMPEIQHPPQDTLAQEVLIRRLDADTVEFDFGKDRVIQITDGAISKATEVKENGKRGTFKREEAQSLIESFLVLMFNAKDNKKLIIYPPRLNDLEPDLDGENMEPVPVPNLDD